MRKKYKAKPLTMINKIARCLNKISNNCCTSAIILAGGKSVRMDNISKQLIDICGKPVIIPAGYNRSTYLCPRCHKAIPLSEKMLEELQSSAKVEEKPKVTSPCRRDSLL